MRKSTAFALMAAALALPARADAQAFVGVGVGAANVAEDGPGQSEVRPSLHARLGVGLGRGVALVLEGQAHALDDGEVRIDDSGSDAVVQIPTVLGTDVLLLGVQVDVANGVYVRPALGVGRHAFGWSRLEPNGTFTPGEGHEWSLSGGASAGYRVRLGRRVSLAVEASGLWSGGEDSSGDRTVFGLQVIPTLGL